LLAEEEGAGPREPATDKGDAKPEKTPRWVWPAGAAATLLLAIGAGLVFWPVHDRTSVSPDGPDTFLVTKRVGLEKPELQAQQQIAAAQPGGNAEMIVGKAAETSGGCAAAGPTSDLSATEPDFRACEKFIGR
jgi:hypothetical protein